MSILGNDLLLAGTDEGYNLTRSLRFRSSASAYLNRTATAGNRKTWTWSGWVKRGLLNTSASGKFFGAGSSGVGNTGFQIGFGNESSNSDTIYMQQSTWGTSNALVLETNAVFRDPSAWYHIVLAIDTTQATDTNRVKLYVNGVQITSFNGPSYPSQNTDLLVNNSGTTQFLAAAAGYSGQRYFDGYLTEVNFIDGQALTPSSFGSTNTLTGVWQPARYTGTYGTNGFYLPFTDNSALTTSSNAGLGKDFSGNGNYWTTNNISITSGVTYDSMTDVPTLTSATAANFAVLNPLDKYSSITVSGGNLNAICADVAWRSGAMTFGNFTTGKWYYEVTANSIGGSTYISAGWELTSLNHTAQSGGVGAASGNNFGVYINSNSRVTKVNGSTFSSDSNTNSNGDVLMFAVDFDAGKGWIGKNGTWYDSGNPSAGTSPCTTTVSGGMTPAYEIYNNGDLSFNAGQRPFAYTPPTGFVALNTYNLPTSTIVKGNTVMDATTYTGNGTTTGNTQTITNAAGFKPDLVWIKSRSAAQWNVLVDSVRGANKTIYSNDTYQEESLSNVMNSFNSNGFTAAYNSAYSSVITNANGATYVGWQWQAGQGTTSSNTSGTVTSTVSVNASAGFSVVTYTGTGANATVGHGLGVAPSLIICKARSTTGSWQTYHSSIGNTSAVFLNLDSAAFASSVYWNNTSPTSSVFSIGTSSFVNVASQTQVAYCFAPIAGYSAFGSYTGNGSSDGPMVYLGFRPKYFMWKRTDAATDWLILDTARAPYNSAGNFLFADLSNAEYSSNPSYQFDFLSNGIKVRSAASSDNASGGTYIYMAFAENPFKNALAR